MGNRLTPPVVSVIVPTRDRLGFLIECVGSVRHQALENWELIVVNDASTDGTATWLTELTDSRIRVLHLAERAERSAARNRGLAVARAEFVLFLDDDDKLRPDALGHLVTALRETPDSVVATFGGATMFDGRGHRQRSTHPPVRITTDIWIEVLFGFMPGAPGRACIRKQWLNRVGGWPDTRTFLEDSDLWLRLARHGPVKFVPRTVLNARVHENQYRPQNAAEMHDELRRSYVATLSGADRRIAQRVLASRDRWQAGLERSGAGRFADATKEFVGAVRQCPELLRSPVVGPALVSRILQTVGWSALGPLGLPVRNAGADLKAALRNASKRLPSRSGAP